jgi:hypothetical protein
MPRHFGEYTHTDKEVCEALRKGIGAGHRTPMRLLIDCGISYQCAKERSATSPRIKELYERYMAEIDDRIMEKGLTGEYNSRVAGLYLQNRGWAQRQDITTGGEKIQAQAMDSSKATTEQLEAIADIVNAAKKS